MIKPMLCKLVKEPFNDKEWIFEIKWDGYRALAEKNRQIKLLSRNQKSFNHQFPLIVKELGKLPGRFILDGEIVILDKKGCSRFQLLQNLKASEGVPLYYIFDILSFEGNKLVSLPLIERKKILKALIGKRKWKYLRYSEYVEQFGKKLFNFAKKKNLEGIIAKRKDSSYVSTRSSNWLKIKTSMRQEVVIGGFTQPKGSRAFFGALLVGVYDDQELIYAGHVGGGFNHDLLKKIYFQMIKLEKDKSPFVHSPKPNDAVTWVKPKLVCEVSFTEWTKEGVMRHPIFQGMRIDKSPKQVVRE
jgi:bifunctional non-homologous end joining protein LigD